MDILRQFVLAHRTSTFTFFWCLYNIPFFPSPTSQLVLPSTTELFDTTTILHFLAEDDEYRESLRTGCEGLASYRARDQWEAGDVSHMSAHGKHTY
jgi:hypothetical protein